MAVGILVSGVNGIGHHQNGTLCKLFFQFTSGFRFCQFLLIPFFRIQIRKPDQEPAAHNQNESAHPGLFRQGFGFIKGGGHFALEGIVAASGQHVEHVLPSRQRGVVHFMALFAFHVYQLGIVTFHVIIQVAVYPG